MDRVAVGIIGFGRIGAEHAAWINASNHARLAAVFDPTQARRDVATARGFRTFSNIDDLLRSDLEAVLVSSPTSMHFDHAMIALAANKHVMVEKPIALDFAQANIIVDQAKKRGRVLSIFQNRRWDIDYLTVGRAIDDGTFGRIINIESRLGQWSSCVGPAAREWRPQWRNEAAFGGGGLYDWGSHFVDQLWQLMLPAKAVRVFAQLRGNVWTKDCDDFARVLLDFDNGAVGLVEINTTTTRPLPRWHIDGTSGSAESPFSLAFDTSAWAQLKFTPADGAADQMIQPAPRGLTEGQIWDSFALALGGKAAPAVSAESVLVTMSLLDAARESSQSGRAVEISLPDCAGTNS
jgi:scyllo-inositol 2-dehydrogenase (NADP+)